MIVKEIILSTVQNTGKDIANAPFWKNCYKKEEVTPEMLGNGKQWYEYHVKFNDNRPIQLTKTNKLRKSVN